MGLDADLRAALNARVVATAGFPVAVELENTAVSGKAFVPPVSDPWARVTHRFADEVLRTLPAPGGRLERFGVVLVDCFVPLLSGSAALDTLAQAVRDQCPPNLYLDAGGHRCRVRRSQRLGGARRDAFWWDQISISWACWAVNPLTG